MKSESEGKRKRGDCSTAEPNPLFAEIRANANKKDSKRRHWTTNEEDIFFKLWGRENYRLTKTGKVKNTIHFAKWAEELKESYGIETSAAEVQSKVNQSRSKYRQEKKRLEKDINATPWKKYELIEKILKNEYRSEDADPIPPELLLNNRDFSALELKEAEESKQEMHPTPAITPSSITSNSQDSVQQQQQQQQQQQLTQNHMHEIENHNQIEHQNLNIPEQHGVGGELYTTTALYSLDIAEDLQKTTMPLEVKQNDFSNDYPQQQPLPPHSANMHQQTVYITTEQYESTPNQYVTSLAHHENEAPQLLELQTIHHQHQSQEPMHTHHQQIQYNHQIAATNCAPPQHTSVQNGIIQLNQHQMPQQTHIATSYEQHPAINTYTTNTETVNFLSANQNHYTQVVPQQVQLSALPETQLATTAIATEPMSYPPYLGHLKPEDDLSNVVSMQPPAPITTPLPMPTVTTATSQEQSSVVVTPQTAIVSAAPRKRVRHYTQNSMPANTNLSSLETQFLEEIRKKNAILEEQKEIAKKRLCLEERKISLMEVFFPKCLEMQMKIMDKFVSSQSRPESVPEKKPVAKRNTARKTKTDNDTKSQQLIMNGDITQLATSANSFKSSPEKLVNNKDPRGNVSSEEQLNEELNSSGSRKQSVIQKLLESIEADNGNDAASNKSSENCE